MRTIGINCDLGESYGIYTFGNDEELMPFITHANVACGYHASDPIVMWNTVAAAKKYNIGIGAHPGLPDREGFGRRQMKLTRKEVSSLTLYQVGALKAFLDAEGVKMSHFKAHGQLFGMAQDHEEMAEGLADAAEILQVPVIGFSNCIMEEVYKRRRIPYECEFYADLDYTPAGRQIISRSHGAIDVSKLSEKIRRAVQEGKATATDGSTVDVVADTICVHSDGKTAKQVATIVRDTLQSMGMLRGK